MPRILAIDIGTSRIKAAVFDETGNMDTLQSRRLNRADSPDTQSAETWFDAGAALLREVTANASGKTPDAVALTGNMHALLGVASDFSPVAPAQLWSSNIAQAESDELPFSRFRKFCI